MMAGTEIMTVGRLEHMEARVDMGEVDVVLIAGLARKPAWKWIRSRTKSSTAW